MESNACPTCGRPYGKRRRCYFCQPGRARGVVEIRKCYVCGHEFQWRLIPSRDEKATMHRGLYCSRVCSNKSDKPGRRRRGKDHPNWKGGHVSARTGYRMVPNDRKLVPEHRLVMARQVGRALLPDETVHHRNGVKHDNRPENLELWSSRHPKGQRVEDLVAFAREILDLYGDLT